VRIAQVAPLQEAVPPRFYGGTERVVSYLTEKLVQLGHDVTLFASGDSKTQARLVLICQQALRLDPDGIAWSMGAVTRHVRTPAWSSRPWDLAALVRMGWYEVVGNAPWHA
jgi:hypothetical protein